MKGWNRGVIRDRKLFYKTIRHNYVTPTQFYYVFEEITDGNIRVPDTIPDGPILYRFYTNKDNKTVFLMKKLSNLKQTFVCKLNNV